jgi:hypothetical protein
VIQTTGRVVGQVADSLKDHPLALALVVVNVMFLAMTSGVLYSVSKSGERRDKLLTDLVTNCRLPEQR